VPDNSKKLSFAGTMKQQVFFTDLGKNQPYKEVWDLQESLLQENAKIKSDLRSGMYDAKELQTSDRPQTVNRLLFVEHNPVYTLGKSGDISHVLINDEDRNHKGIEFFKINRGGDITFHGPEQLVGYPIFDLEYFRTDLGWYLRSLEEVIILTMAEYGLQGDRSEGETGVWLDPHTKGKERKICAMGIRCSRWITMHGFAFNINTDLNYFNYIIPCGIQNKQVTSLEKELGYTVPFDEVKEKVKRNFEKVFNIEVIENTKAI
jgi:lipoyl(octanoyl) transferase